MEKSTLTSTLSGAHTILDPDRYALEYGGAISGGKVLLAEFLNLIEQRQSFLIETTLSGVSPIKRMHIAKNAGFKVELHYISVVNIDIAKKRVSQRVAMGGHDVPVQDQERRFSRSLDNAVIAAGIADENFIYDNSTKFGHELILQFNNSGKIKPYSSMPFWCRKVYYAFRKANS